MKVLLLAALFPPNVVGGAEMSAFNTAQLLSSKGHDVSVLTSAKNAQQVVKGEPHDKLEKVRIWRALMPRPYPMYEAQQAPSTLKPLWHLQDHFDPRNKSVLDEVLNEVNPDVVFVHILQGLGYNLIESLSDRNLPTIFILHDLSLVCFRMAMYRNGRDCEQLCKTCKLSYKWKSGLMSKMSRYAFSSPSQANLDKVLEYYPVPPGGAHSVLNPNTYPLPRNVRIPSEKFRLSFVGRIHESKGIDFLLTICEILSKTYQIHIDILGDGPLLPALKSKYGSSSWCTFHGFISQQEIADIMNQSDILCIPSMWRENSPGVVVHALTIGLPVLGSNRGGIPELVKDGITGRLLPTGDFNAWLAELERLINNPSDIATWRAHAIDGSSQYNVDNIYKKIINIVDNL